MPSPLTKERLTKGKNSDGNLNYGVVVALEDDGCWFDYYPASHKPLEDRKCNKFSIKLFKGQILIFHMWLIHAGSLSYILIIFC